MVMQDEFQGQSLDGAKTGLEIDNEEVKNNSISQKKKRRIPTFNDKNKK